MSNLETTAPRFFDLYSRGEVAANRIEDFVSQWHASGEKEDRSLASFLGLTDEEYEILLIDPEALPQVLYARRTGKPLREVMAAHLAAIQRGGRPEDRGAMLALGHWLQARPAH